MGATLFRDDWSKVGEFGVDAGIVWIGDPCYVIHRDGPLPDDMGKDWLGFCDKLQGAVTQFDLGVCSSTAHGDGVYSVYATHGTDGGVVGLFIDLDGVFNPDPDEDDEYHDEYDDEYGDDDDDDDDDDEDEDEYA